MKGRLHEVAIPVGLAEQGIAELPIRPIHCRRVQGLPFHYKDPFDRLLIAQALVEGLDVIECDAQLDTYGVRRIWCGFHFSPGKNRPKPKWAP